MDNLPVSASNKSIVASARCGQALYNPVRNCFNSSIVAITEG